MRKTITTLLAGILSFGSVNKSNAQNNPAAAYQTNVLNGGFLISTEKEQLIKEKQSFDYLIDNELVSVLFASQNNLSTLRVEDIFYGNNYNVKTYTIKSSKGKITAELSSYLGSDERGEYLKAYICNDSFMPFAIRSYQQEILIGKPSKVNFFGPVLEKSFTIDINYSNKQPVDASGTWGGLEIKVAYFPSKEIPWLIDHKEVQLTNSTDKSVTTYNVKYDFGEFKTENGIFMGYTGFTVTKQSF